jgi:dienelactone hydrolase
VSAGQGARPSPGLAAQVLVDEVLIAAMKNPRLFPHRDDYVRAGRDIAAAHELWTERGWLDDPERFHVNPAAPADATISRQRTLNVRYEHLEFSSGYEPHAGEPGRTRWLEHERNRTAHAWVLRHREPGRPWLVCVHGFGMGTPMMDLRGFRVLDLHRRLGLNVLLPVLPLHGPRQTPGTANGEGFMSIDLIDAVHGLAQSAYDVRATMRWIRAEHGDVPIGIYGLSLGGYVTALTASLEDGLACAIPGIPATDLVDLYRRHSPRHVRRRAQEHGALGPEAVAVHRVVSPLVLHPTVPQDRRFLFAGVGDRMSTSGQARRLWEHWDRPEIRWYPGGHVGFFWASGVAGFVTEALTKSGLVSSS